jgi:hypothetical protein
MSFSFPSHVLFSFPSSVLLTSVLHLPSPFPSTLPFPSPFLIQLSNSTFILLLLFYLLYCPYPLSAILPRVTPLHHWAHSMVKSAGPAGNHNRLDQKTRVPSPSGLSTALTYIRLAGSLMPFSESLQYNIIIPTVNLPACL